MNLLNLSSKYEYLEHIFNNVIEACDPLLFFFFQLSFVWTDTYYGLPRIVFVKSVLFCLPKITGKDLIQRISKSELELRYKNCTLVTSVAKSRVFYRKQYNLFLPPFQLTVNSATSAFCSQGTWRETLGRPLLLFMHVSDAWSCEGSPCNAHVTRHRIIYSFLCVVYTPATGWDAPCKLKSPLANHRGRSDEKIPQYSKFSWSIRFLCLCQDLEDFIKIIVLGMTVCERKVNLFRTLPLTFLGLFVGILGLIFFCSFVFKANMCVPSVPGVILVETNAFLWKCWCCVNGVVRWAESCVIAGTRISWCSTIKAMLIWVKLNTGKN